MSQSQNQFAWLDGKLVPLKKATVPLLTHSLHYGSAVFEGIRFYQTPKGPAIFRLSEHVDRLLLSARVLAMPVKYSKAELMRAIIATVKKNKLPAGYIRPIIYYGEKMGLNPTGAPLHIAIAAWPWGSYLGDKPVSVKTSSYIRIHPDSVETKAKVSGYYVNSIYATLEAHKSGFHEALLLDHNGNVAEGPGENIFMVKRGKLYTPPLGTILPGITRNTIIALARELKISVTEKKLKLSDLKSADELFFCGTAAEVTSIGKLDAKKFTKAPGPITSRIRAHYLNVVHGNTPQHQQWLTFMK